MRRDKLLRVRHGVTLLELIIALLVLSLLLILAQGSFHSYLLRANRQVAAQIMLQDAEFMEKYYSLNGKYTSGHSWPRLPYPVAPEAGVALYRIQLLPTVVTASADNAYSLVAIPRCGQPLAGDSCICVDQDSNVNLQANAACNNGPGGCECTPI